jgi:hypothetical protein
MNEGPRNPRALQILTLRSFPASCFLFPVSCFLFVQMPKARLELARAGARQILSLLRLPIPPLGRCPSNINCALRFYAVLFRRRPSSTRCTLRRLSKPFPSSPTHLIHLPADLLLHAEVARALHRREELGQLALLSLGHVDPLALELELVREQLFNARRVRRIVLQHFIAKSPTCHHLTTVQVAALTIEALVHFRQLTHPFIAQAKLRLEQCGQLLAKALFHLLAIRPSTADPLALGLTLTTLRAAHRQR